MTKEQQLKFSDFIKNVNSNSVTPEMVMELLHQVPDFAKELLKLLTSESERNKEKYLSDNEVILKLVDSLRDVINNNDIPADQKIELAKLTEALIRDAMKQKGSADLLHHERNIEIMTVVKWMSFVVSAVVVAYLLGKRKFGKTGDSENPKKLR